MARPKFTTDEDKLQRRFDQLKAQQEEKTRVALARREREMRRRREYAALYEPHNCVKELPDGTGCTRFAIPGGFFCIHHGGDVKAAREAAKMRLLALVEPALRVMNMALASDDIKVALKAATLLLDRSGFGPSSSIEVEKKETDITGLSKEELLERGKALMQQLHLLEEKKKIDERIHEMDESPVDETAIGLNQFQIEAMKPAQEDPWVIDVEPTEH